MSINSYLENLQNNLNVNGNEIEKIRTSIDAISQRLDWYFGSGKTNEHKILKKETFGSYSRNTILSRRYDEKSDVDYMIIFEDAKEYNPQTCLNWLKDFAEYYYSTSIVRQSLPTVVIELQNIKFELVPAYLDMGLFKYVALNPTTWQYTNPDDLKEKMLQVNMNSNYIFKRMIRCVKYWNVNKNNRMYQSFDIEKYLTEKFSVAYGNCSNLLDYIDWAFYYLRSKYVNDDVHKRVEKAYDLVTEAKELEILNRYTEAEDKIKSIFE